ncbi:MULTISPECIES: hypothetical protein [Stenotrophomonas]|uniref:hypothetical protein n=1 Tax=Stenotrophomonas TaxID=40323 RepID=UPI000D53D5BA|nr:MULTISPECIES: hypothetical protein [Stenotrophomonas]AWH31153.1 hypothetical protein C1931_05275 [Stenotrophomonas sp. YAU14A_MKIMI4_1]AWH35081.1 hypothetical protein C1930_05560 [Stenotrophomonas sp. SAU14A_NAIMI4_8]
MRGRRPALASLLAWIAMLALLLGTLPLLPVAHAGLAQAQQQPLEERGGERGAHEEAPAKLRRCAAAPQKTTDTAPPLLLARQWLHSELQLIPTAPAHAVAQPDWPLAAPDTPWADAPGRRQQRGQAPPLA